MTKAQADAIDELVKIACMIAIETPERRNPYAGRAYVDWRHVDRIRAILPAAGIDYAAARKRYAEILAADRAAQRKDKAT